MFRCKTNEADAVDETVAMKKKALNVRYLQEEKGKEKC
jgi:hypothetical protein